MSPTIKEVKEGFNKFCGPAVLSILTGKSTDECANVISRISGSYKVTGVQLNHLLEAASKLGFTQESITPKRSLFSTIISIVDRDGMYIVTLPNHFVVLEIKNKEVFFCDNHTKHPIKAASSARLGQEVIAIHRVSPKPDFKIEERKEVIKTTIRTIDHNMLLALLGLKEAIIYIEYNYGDKLNLNDNPITVITTEKTYEISETN